ncbi:MAG: hypothetical protein AB7O62_18385 [Pirellulales bacterium]
MRDDTGKNNSAVGAIILILVLLLMAGLGLGGLVFWRMFERQRFAERQIIELEMMMQEERARAELARRLAEEARAQENLENNGAE